MNKSPELFSPERPVRSDFARQRGIPFAVRRLITLCVLFGLVGGGGMWIWHHAASNPGEIPTIKADGVYKERPDQPGGIDIPHQDVQVYHEIDGSAAANNAKPVVEHLLPLPEQPNLSANAKTMSGTSVSVPVVSHVEDLTPQAAAPSSVASDQSPAVTAALLPPAAAPVVTTVASPVVPPAVRAPTVPAPAAVAPTIASPPVQAPQVAKPVAPVPSAEAAPAVKGGAILQLAATQDQNAAQNLVQKLQIKYSAILGAARLHSVRADLGAKGIFYRIQSQSLSAQQAQNICAALKNINAGCILVRL